MLKYLSVVSFPGSAVVLLTSALAQVFTLLVITTASAQNSYLVGVASVDITPDYPIRLNGFGNRRAESEGVSQPIFAKALARLCKGHQIVNSWSLP